MTSLASRRCIWLASTVPARVASLVFAVAASALARPFRPLTRNCSAWISACVLVAQRPRRRDRARALDVELLLVREAGDALLELRLLQALLRAAPG